MTAFAALADPSRRRILDVLREGERAVGELVDHLRISQPAVSKQLRILKDAGLVGVRPAGRRRLYALRAAPLAEVDAQEGRAQDARVKLERLTSEFPYTEWGRRAAQRLRTAAR